MRAPFASAQTFATIDPLPIGIAPLSLLLGDFQAKLYRSVPSVGAFHVPAFAATPSDAAQPDTTNANNANTANTPHRLFVISCSS
jgi:hypothetical protein